MPEWQEKGYLKFEKYPNYSHLPPDERRAKELLHRLREISGVPHPGGLGNPEYIAGLGIKIEDLRKWKLDFDAQFDAEAVVGEAWKQLPPAQKRQLQEQINREKDRLIDEAIQIMQDLGLVSKNDKK
ncbi:hypothetical protein ACFL2Q_09555 [Thermodesulfobacteriota bacterium]